MAMDKRSLLHPEAARIRGGDMRANGLGARLARLEDRLRPQGPREIVVWCPEEEPEPEVPDGAMLLKVVYADSDEDDVRQ